MVNQEMLRRKPLSYEASKAVLKSLTLETREAINRRIPALRIINSRLPYVLEHVDIEADTFEINGRRWNTKLLRPIRDGQVVDRRKSIVVIFHVESCKQARYRVNKSHEEILEQLFDEYIRNGTVVKGLLRFYGIPEFLKGRRKGSKIKVTNLHLETKKTEDYEHFIRFIDLDVLENVKLFALENTLALLDKPEIKTIKNLTVYFCFGSRPTNFSIDQFLRLRNQHLRLESISFTLHELQLFVEDWITTGREIGMRFTWEPRRSDNVLQILEDLKTHFGADEAGSHLEYYFSDKTIHGNGITLKMKKRS